MTLEGIWFFLVAFLLTGYVILDGFDLGAGVLYPFIARTEAEKARDPRLDRAGMGRQRGLAGDRRRRGVRGVSHGLRVDVQRLLSRHHARALRADPARRIARVPPSRRRAAPSSGTAPSSSAALCRRCSSGALWATSSAAYRWTPTATTPVRSSGFSTRTPCWSGVPGCSLSSPTARPGSALKSERAARPCARYHTVSVLGVRGAGGVDVLATVATVPAPRTTCSAAARLVLPRRSPAVAALHLWQMMKRATSSRRSSARR